MKKVLCLVLSVLLLLPTVLVANAQTADFICYWGFENQEEDYNSMGGLEVRFPAFEGATGYDVTLYKDGQVAEQVFVDGEMYTYIEEDAMISDIYSCDMSDYIVEFGNGAYTASVSAVRIDYEAEDWEPKVLATTPVSNPYIYTEPAVTLAPVQNVVYDGSKITYTHESAITDLTYQMECKVEYGDYRTYTFYASSDFKPEMAPDRAKWMWEHYEEALVSNREYSPELLERGEPKLVVVIYAKAWDINAAMQSPKTYFYPNGEKPTYTEPYAVPVWTESKNAMLSFAGAQSEVEAYNIYDNNYFKLRDLALKLTQMGVPVEVTWDEEKQAINLISGMEYTQVGGELKAADNTAREAVPCKSRIYINGAKAELKAYNINGNNFFKLRDLCAVLNVKVDWDEAAQMIILNK